MKRAFQILNLGRMFMVYTYAMFKIVVIGELLDMQYLCISKRAGGRPKRTEVSSSRS